MDVYVVYLFVATATPLFLWQDHRKLAMIQIPFIAILWGFVGFYLAGALNAEMHLLFNILFVTNVVFAHVAAFKIYAIPFIRREREKRMAALTKPE
ncbi:protein required for proper spore morphogenesis and germination [Fictibacillus macauensis ZFHKF-1]|uniref:Protein required for proper spore morphogenesis and germination n=1 Tax=Fictibacillus macauensis ZFHKF-1 TaxID=1196324 RepID=I8J6B0_9BACL|nr:spore morphogenesis/germination protein YwcE [Fictibacillus macauensis]EIT87351.1 protein required for proper spore morphogenesis and germination [Fictibacillus macauensis ZFHKF-1]